MLARMMQMLMNEDFVEKLRTAKKKQVIRELERMCAEELPEYVQPVAYKFIPVSYTHLDVYKRQVRGQPRRPLRLFESVRSKALRFPTGKRRAFRF